MMNSLMSKLLAIGDIHGDVNQLKKILKKFANRIDIYIFLGDYIDRGNFSKEVIEELILLSQESKCIFLSGNHEVHLKQYLKDGDLYKYAKVGGLETIESYVGKNVTGDVLKALLHHIPLSHMQFFDGLIASYEISNFVFVHNLKSLLKISDEKIYVFGHMDYSFISTNQFICLNKKTTGEVLYSEIKI